MIVFGITCTSRTSLTRRTTALHVVVRSSALKLKQKNGGPLNPGVCIGLKVVKNWGLHPIIERSTLEDIFKRLRNGKLEGASRVLLPEPPDDAEYKDH